MDIANIEQISHRVRLGVVTGVTTNPTIICKEGKVHYRKLVQKACLIVPGPVSTEVPSQDAQEMIAEARQIARWAQNIVVEIPASLEGVEAASLLASENTKVNFAYCFTFSQAVFGAYTRSDAEVAQ